MWGVTAGSEEFGEVLEIVSGAGENASYISGGFCGVGDFEVPFFVDSFTSYCLRFRMFSLVSSISLSNDVSIVASSLVLPPSV